jgi:hypothetical protein
VKKNSGKIFDKLGNNVYYYFMDEENLQYGMSVSDYDNLINRYQIRPSDGNLNINTNNTLIIPSILGKVLKKSIEGLKDITIESYEKTAMYNPDNFMPTYRYSVNLILTFSWDTGVISGPENLKETINTCFSCMFPDIDNYRFNVIRIKTEERDFDKEFFEFFTKG